MNLDQDTRPTNLLAFALCLARFRFGSVGCGFGHVNILALGHAESFESLEVLIRR
jgi:hypothetical protein